MFIRMIKRTLVHQWKKMIMIAFTIALGASLATAMLSVMLDVGDKVNQELKTYGTKQSWEISKPYSGRSTLWITPRLSARKQRLRTAAALP
jgi:hypothetical protein